ncbi:IS4 family transposase [Enterobacter cloacae]|uniref:IS4 family transposase n=1 Tax=Enterobacter cloacae TaxID=550 RepID=A0A377LQY1_ENTCL|nr:IS4 family transposase [Enterobacter cloacae]
MKISELEATGQPVCVGYGVLSRKPRTPVTAGSICISALTQGVREKGDAENTAGTPQ